MRFETIEQFNSLVTKCEFCGDLLKTGFHPRTTPDFMPRYSMNFTTTTFIGPLEQEAIAFKSTLQSDDPQIIKYSSIEHDDLLTFQYDFSGVSHPIFSVDKKTGKIMGDLNRVQKVIWDHKLALSRFCENTICKQTGNRYLSQTTMMVLERVNKRLCSFSLGMEMLTINSKNGIYGLLTPYDNNKFNKTLLVAVQKNEIIKQLPIIHLHKIKGGDVIINKIKTLITFS